jgi:ABC-type dipeptide/oligopeptide/nickel transport system permease subunit
MLAMLISGARISLWSGCWQQARHIYRHAAGRAFRVPGGMGGQSADALHGYHDDLPFFLLLVLIVFIFGPSLAIIVLVIGLTGCGRGQRA